MAVARTDRLRQCLISSCLMLSLAHPQLAEASPPKVELNVAGDALAVDVQRVRKTTLGLEVTWGRAADARFEALSDYVNVVLVRRQGSSRVIGSFEDARGLWRLSGDLGGPLVARLESTPGDRPPCGHELGSPPQGLTPPPAAAQDGDSACGIIYLDMFMGFTENAAMDTPDLEAEATLITELANTGLHNSHVPDIRVRLVGTGTTPMDGGVTTAFLSQVESLMGPEAYALGADIIGIVATDQMGEDEAGGWAYVPGHVQVVLSGLTNAWRHELGHNVGASHCQPEGGGITPYAYGHDPGGEGLTTHMCGNASNFYSTPWVENQGLVVGDEETADMARLWHERAAAMSEHRVHQVEFPPCEEDVEGPSVAIVEPAPPVFNVPDDQLPLSVNLLAEAEDPGYGVQDVRLQVDGTEVPNTRDDLWPYQWALNFPAGSYEVVAIATDFNDNETLSEPVTVQINDDGSGESSGDSQAGDDDAADTSDASETEPTTNGEVGSDEASDDDGEDGGCSCSAVPTTPLGALVQLWPLALLGLGRRRREL